MNRREKRKRKRLEKEKGLLPSGVLFLYKKEGETPLERLKRFENSFYFLFLKIRQKFLCWKRGINRKGCYKIPLAYAGRLDPMAEGKLLVLIGESCKKLKDYYSLNKEYEVEILFGLKSDSGDILGLVERDFMENFKEKEIKEMNFKIMKRKGRWKMKYPVFSSKTVLGKPLFLWKLEGKINEIKIPEKEVEIYDLKIISWKKKKIKDIKKEVFARISKIKKVEEKSKELGNDFRRVDILKNWERVLADFSDNDFFWILKIRTKVSSGTYMRKLAEEIGKDFGKHALAYSIRRKKIFLKNNH